MIRHEAAIRDGFAAGLSCGQIARNLAASPTTIQRQAKRLGLRSGHCSGEPAMSAAAEDTIRRRIAAGHSYRAIAASLKCSRSSVMRAIKRMGLIKPTPVPFKTLDAMFEEGLPSRTVAQKTGAALAVVQSRRDVWAAQRRRDRPPAPVRMPPATLTAEDQAEIERLIELSWNTAKIVRHKGYSQEQVLEARRARKQRRANEMAAAAGEPLPAPVGDLLTALRAHMPLDAVTVAWLRDDAKRLRAVESYAEAARQQAPSLRALRLPSLREVRAAA